MFFERFSRADMVLPLTLAEIFLLLLFVAWWGVALEREGIEGTSNPGKLIEELRSQISTLTVELAHQKRIVEFVRKMLGAQSPSEEDLKKAFGQKLEAARRGSPKCTEGDNTLVDVVVANGSVTVVLLGRSPAWAAFAAHAPAGFAPDVEESDRARIQELLDAVSRYYVNRSECRFDYRLRYATKEDYYDARQWFENPYLYLGPKLTRIAQ